MQSPTFVWVREGEMNEKEGVYHANGGSLFVECMEGPGISLAELHDYETHATKEKLEAYRAAQGPPLVPLRISIPSPITPELVEPTLIQTSIRKSPELFDRLKLGPPPRPRPTSVYSPMGIVRKVTLLARPKVGRTQSTGDVPGGSTSTSSSSSSSSSRASRSSNQRSAQLVPQRRQSDISSELIVQSLQNPRRDSPSPSPSHPPRSKSSRPMTAPIQTTCIYPSSANWDPHSNESTSPISSEELTTPTSTNGSSSAGESSSSLSSSRSRTLEMSNSARGRFWRDSIVQNPFSSPSHSPTSFDQVVRSPGMLNLDTMSEEEDVEVRKKMEKRGKRMSLTGVAGELVSRAFKSSFGGSSKGNSGNESGWKDEEFESERDGSFQVINRRPPILRSHSTPSSSLLSLPTPPLQPPTPSLDLGPILEIPEDCTSSPSALALSNPLPPSPPISISNFERSNGARSLKTRPRVKSLLTTTRPVVRPIVKRRYTGDGVVLPLHARDIFGSSEESESKVGVQNRGEEEQGHSIESGGLELFHSTSLSTSRPF